MRMRRDGRSTCCNHNAGTVWLFLCACWFTQESGSHVHLCPRPYTLCSPCAHGPSWPCSHRKCVIARRLGCLRWLAHAAGHGHFFGASATRRTVSFFSFTTTHTTNLKSKIGDGFPSERAVLGTCGTACLPPRRAQDASFRVMKTN